jgi:hypothetical protein
MKKATIVFFRLITIAVVAMILHVQSADARLEYWSSTPNVAISCSTCHSSSSADTCKGCHAHGTHTEAGGSDINITATTDKTTYAPGETVSVTIDGGNTSGWSFNVALQAQAPKLFFSDLEGGPKTGWEGSTTKGAAVTVWGKGFGYPRGSSYVTVNGVNLTNATDYAEWGAVGPARDQERITFWLNSGCQDGAGTITVTVDGVASNALPFTVRGGDIYFVAKDGNDNNNGRYDSDQGVWDGPWLHFYKTNSQDNTVLQGGDIVYVRAGIYDDIDEQSSMIYLRALNYSAGAPLAVVGYPGEYPVLGPSATIGVYMGDGTSSYLQWHKMIWENPSYSFKLRGNDFRLVGNIFRNNTADVWTGVIGGGTAWDVKILGNLFKDLGYDKYKHVIYIKGKTDVSHPMENIEVGWNEFDNVIGDGGGEAESGGGIIDVKGLNDQYPVRNYVIHDNLFHDSHYVNVLHVTGDCYDVHFYNNVVWNVSHYARGASKGALKWAAKPATDRLYQYNNTFYDVGSTGIVEDISFVWVENGNTLRSMNNIFYSVNNEPYVQVVETGSALNSTNDLYYGNPGAPSGSGLTITNTVTEDPQFVGIANHDFRLQATSPAKDAGTSGVNPALTRDYNSIARPQDGGYDIGAYEFYENDVTQLMPVRAILYNEAGVAQSSGSEGGQAFPMTLIASAPMMPGTYTFSASWYGNQYDRPGAMFGSGWAPDPTNPGHGEEIVATNVFDVVSAAPAGAGIGVFREGLWFLDSNSNGTWESGMDALFSEKVSGSLTPTAMARGNRAWMRLSGDLAQEQALFLLWVTGTMTVSMR